MTGNPLGDALFARLLCDLMIPAELSAAIRAHGYDVAEARDLSPAVQIDDWALLQEATDQQRLIVTCNYSDPAGNFCTIHSDWQARGKKHHGILLIPQFQISSRV